MTKSTLTTLVTSTVKRTLLSLTRLSRLQRLLPRSGTMTVTLMTDYFDTVKIPLMNVGKFGKDYEVVKEYTMLDF